jgi:pyruvate-ferredoxin/flavodoxin oxidoreductase
MRASYPRQIARRLVESLVKQGGGAAVAELLTMIPGVPEAAPAGNGTASPPEPATATATVPPPVAEPTPEPVSEPAPQASAPAAAADDDDDDDALVMEAYIDTLRCTTCNECTNLNNRMFAYNDDKQAYIKDPSAGTFQQLVLAAERCPVSLIHPGTPLNPKEKDLEKWVKRAERFN